MFVFCFNMYYMCILVDTSPEWETISFEVLAWLGECINYSRGGEKCYLDLICGCFLLANISRISVTL